MADRLQGFAEDARRAVAAAEAEARQLGHGRVGTEHLLLGLLGDPGSDAATALTEAGVTLAAARYKVREAVGPTNVPADAPPAGLSARADRALGRAVRFARRSPAGVTSEHLLLAVLDVEGTAGQVLRGLGVDPERLRSPSEPVPSDEDPEPEPAVEALRCPACRAAIDEDSLVARRVGEARVFACGACRTVLGVTDLL